MTRFASSLLVILVVVLALPCLASEDEKSTNTKAKRQDSTTKAKSLDKQLLDDLNNDLLDGLDEFPKQAPAKNSEDKENEKKPSSAKPKDDTDSKLLDQLGEGEDIEIGQENDPLTRIGKKMRTVEKLISRQRTSTTTQRLQKEILEDLAVLIELQKKRCAACSAAKGSNKPKSGNTAAGTDASGDPSGPEKSTERIGKSDIKPTEIMSREDLVRESWGQLPERFLQQLQNAGVERFLPKYEKLIEDYYKRLAEDNRSYR